VNILSCGMLRYVMSYMTKTDKYNETRNAILATITFYNNIPDLS